MIEKKREKRMERFFYLEGPYLILSGIVLLVTLFVTTRPFMGKGAVKKGMVAVTSFLVVAVGAHYTVTTTRMEEVKEAFASGKTILCESRMNRKAAQSIEISKNIGAWRLEGDYFVSPYFERPFFTARCIVK
jgi:hypothetical protein